MALARLEPMEPRMLLSAGPVGGELLVQQFGTEHSIGVGRNGSFVVAYMAEVMEGVWAQRYGADGVAQGNPVTVNFNFGDSHARSAVAVDSSGGFVVACESGSGGMTQDGSGVGIYARLFNAAGESPSVSFPVNTYTAGDQDHPAIAMDSDGDFVIVWQSQGQDGSSSGIYAQRYNAAGVPQGSEFRVNSYTSGIQQDPDIAMDSAGDFVVTWESYDESRGDGIYGQRFSPDAAPIGSEFRVNTDTYHEPWLARVAMDSDGNFVVAWTSGGGQDGSNYGVYAQRYNAAGVAQGSNFRVNTYTTDAQQFPDVAMDSAGDFVIAWQSDKQDGSGLGAYAQRYDANGTPLASEFLVNTTTAGDQSAATVGMDRAGNFIVAWKTNTQIYAQRFDGAPPTLQLVPLPSVTAIGGKKCEFRIAYSDMSAVNTSTLGSGDIVVTNGKGFKAIAQLVSVVSADCTALYRLTPPGGSWDAADAGVYTISLKPNSVADILGNLVAGGTLGSFSVDFAAPTAQLRKLAKVKRGKSPFRFTVTYRDDARIDAASIGAGDILVAGPKKFKHLATFKSKTAVSAGVYTATYEITPPGNAWDARDNGGYTIWLNAKHVRDTTGKATKKTNLGVLTVKC